MTSVHSKPSDLVKAVYFDHLEHFGEPDHSIRFGDGTIRPNEEHFPPLIDVMIWRPDTSTDITTFCTIGMSEKPMERVSHRSELHFAIRREKPLDNEAAIARFLANLATYPFHYRTHFDWWHTLRDPGQIPLYSEGMSVLFHPRFIGEGWDTIIHEEQTVKLLNVVPITQEERRLKNDFGIESLFDRWGDQGIDLFEPR